MLNSRLYIISSFVHVLLLFVFQLNVARATPAPSPDKSIWTVDIDNSPAPPPDKGPPLSAHASRNPALLPYQITGIVGGYLAVATFGVTLLLIVGRRLRRKNLSEKVVYKMEMVRPNTNGTAWGSKDISPISPIKQWESPTDSEATDLWPKNTKRNWVKPSGASHRTQPSMNGSVSTFDESVIESDKARAQSEMERLYAAVAIHDAEQEAKKDQTSLRSPRQAQFTSPLPSPRSEPYYAAYVKSPVQGQLASPVASPQSEQFAYGQQPPLSPNQLSHPMAPTPIPNPMSPPLSPREPRLSERLSKGPLSFFSSRSRSSAEKESFRISVKGLPISNPVGSPNLKNSVGVINETVMSPRIYTPGPPPPTPGLSKTAVVSVMPTISQDDELPPGQQQKSVSIARAGPPRPLALNPPNSTNPQRSLGELPLRSYPTPPQSAPHYKVQYADRRESRVNPGPKTGVPYPHSPYMPFSPVTPLSATIKTGKDLKMAKKMVAKAEKDMVMNDDEIWGN